MDRQTRDVPLHVTAHQRIINEFEAGMESVDPSAIRNFVKMQVAFVHEAARKIKSMMDRRRTRSEPTMSPTKYYGLLDQIVKILTLYDNYLQEAIKKFPVMMGYDMVKKGTVAVTLAEWGDARAAAEQFVPMGKLTDVDKVSPTEAIGITIQTNTENEDVVIIDDEPTSEDLSRLVEKLRAELQDSKARETDFQKARDQAVQEQAQIERDLEETTKEVERLRAGTPSSQGGQDLDTLQVKLDNLKLLLEVHKNKHSSSTELGVALDLMTKMYNSNKRPTSDRIIKMDVPRFPDAKVEIFDWISTFESVFEHNYPEGNERQKLALLHKAAKDSRYVKHILSRHPLNSDDSYELCKREILREYNIVRDLAHTLNNSIFSLQETNNSYAHVHKTLSYYTQHMNELSKRVAVDKFVDTHDVIAMKALKFDIFLFEQVFHTLKPTDRFEFANLYKLSNNDIGTVNDLVNFIDLKAINESRFSKPSTYQSTPIKRLSVMNVTHQATPRRVAINSKNTFSAGGGKPPKEGAASCAFGCKHSHTTTHCNRFNAADVKKRHAMTREVKLCKKCLKGAYPHAGCMKTCKVCNGGHHELLHFTGPPKPTTNNRGSTTERASSATPTIAIQSMNSIPLSAPVTEQILVITTGAKKAVRPTIMANAWYSDGAKQRIRALMDTGATHSVITKSAVERLGLPTRQGQIVRLASVNNKGVTSKTLADVCLSPTTKPRWIKKSAQREVQLNVTAYVVDDLGPANPVFETLEVESLSELIKEHSYGLADYNLDEEHELDILLGTVECSEIMMGKIVRHKGLALQLTKFGYIVTGALRKHAAPGPLSAPATIISDGEFDAGEPGPTSRLFELVAEDDLSWEQLDTETRIVKFQEEPHLFNVDHRQPCWDCRSDDPNQFMENKTVRIRPTVRIQVNKETVRTRALLDTGSTVNLISEAAVNYYKLKKIPLKG